MERSKWYNPTWQVLTSFEIEKAEKALLVTTWPHWTRRFLWEGIIQSAGEQTLLFMSSIAIWSMTQVQYNFSDVSISVWKNGGRFVIVNYQFNWSGAFHHSYNMAKLSPVLLVIYWMFLIFQFLQTFHMRLFTASVLYRLSRSQDVESEI